MTKNEKFIYILIASIFAFLLVALYGVDTNKERIIALEARVDYLVKSNIFTTSACQALLEHEGLSEKQVKKVRDGIEKGGD